MTIRDQKRYAEAFVAYWTVQRGSEKGKRVNSIDDVGAWYYKAAALMVGTADRGRPRCAFVSTNSITQGEQVAPPWRKLCEEYGLEIDFAWRTFVWDSEAAEKAHVHGVIIGFSVGASVPFVRNHNATKDALNAGSGHAGRMPLPKRLFNADGTAFEAMNINPYLVDAPTAFVESRATPLCAAPPMTYGNKPSDGGNLILSQEERDALLARDAFSVIIIRGACKTCRRDGLHRVKLTETSLF